MSAKSKKTPTLTLDVKSGKVHPVGKVHVARQSQGGFVILDAPAACTVLFTDPRVFGKRVSKLRKGSNKRFTKVERGRTFVMVAGCDYHIPRSVGAASNPTDIIVP